MEESDKEVILFYKKRIEPYIAVFILTFLITGVLLLLEDNKLKEEIAENCGYETKDYICYCEKSFIDNQMQLRKLGGIPNVQLVINNSSESIN